MQLEPLILRASPFNGWSNMVDALSKPTPTPLRSPPRAHPEMTITMLHVDVSERMAVWSCEPSVVW